MNKILFGIKSRPKKFITEILFSTALLWSIIEPILGLTHYSLSGYGNYFIYMIVSFIIACYRIIPSKEVCFRLKNTNQIVEIKFGDLFKQHGCIVISVNEFFDSEIGKIVSPKSVHGKFIQNIIQNKNHFDNLINSDLKSIQGEIVNRQDGKNVKYPLGTTAEIDFGNIKYFLLAFCKTDIITHKAKTEVNEMWQALEGLWSKVRNCANGCNTNIALIGHGLSGVGLPPTQLLQIILISLLKATKQQELGCKVSVIIQPENYEEMNIDLIKTNWD